MLRCVIFDMDGTIAETLPLCVAAVRAAIEPKIDRSLSDEQIYATFGPSEEGTIRALLPGGYEEGLRDYLDHYRRLHEMCPEPFEGMKELFTFLKDQGLRLALVTGKGPGSLAISLEILGLENLFEMIETGDPGGPCKPEGIRKVLQALKLQPGECVYIGDTSSDIIATQEVGVPILSAAWAETTDLESLEKLNPKGICKSVGQLREILAAMI